MYKSATVILGHGSRRPEGEAVVLETAERYAETHQNTLVIPAFMEFSERDLITCAEEAIREHGVEEVVIMPFFLAYGNHVCVDLPKQVKTLQENHEGVRFVLTKPIGSDALLCDIIDARIDEALDA